MSLYLSLFKVPGLGHVAMAELRRAEDELRQLSQCWMELRKKRPRFSNGDAAAASDASSTATTATLDLPVVAEALPPLKDLRAGFQDEDIFPVEEEHTDDGNVPEQQQENGTVKTADTSNGSSEVAGYSEFGMCLTSSSNAGELKEESNTEKNPFAKYAAKSITKKCPTPTDSKPAQREDDARPKEDEEMEDVTALEDASPHDILAMLEDLKQRLETLEPKVTKLTARLSARDPITKKARYGEKAINRVKDVIRSYKTLESGVEIALGPEPNLVSSLRQTIRSHEEQLAHELDATRTRQQLESERIAREQQEAEEREERLRVLEETRKREEEEALARAAEEAKQRRLAEEQRLLDEERAADQELLDHVPLLGEQGVRDQIVRMRVALKDDRPALDTALGSLYTLFEQIVSKPEEVKFRRVRRDHPQFVADVGRHVGGREVLIAAGFKLEKLDGKPCFFSREPHIESDMDGWSAWYDSLKNTLSVLEEEMIK